MLGTNLSKASWVLSLLSKSTAMKQWLSSLHTQITSKAKDWLHSKLSKGQRHYLKKALETAKQREYPQKAFKLIVSVMITGLLVMCSMHYTMMVHWYLAGLALLATTAICICLGCYACLDYAAHRYLPMARFYQWLHRNDKSLGKVRRVIGKVLFCCAVFAIAVCGYKYWLHRGIIQANIIHGWSILSSMLPSSWIALAQSLLSFFLVYINTGLGLILFILMPVKIMRAIRLIGELCGMDVNWMSNLWVTMLVERSGIEVNPYKPDVTEAAMKSCEHGKATELKSILENGKCLMMAECATNIGCSQSKTFEFSILDAVCFHGRQDLLFLAKDPSLKNHFKPINLQERLLLAMINGHKVELDYTLSRLEKDQSLVSLYHLLPGLFSCVQRGDVSTIKSVLGNLSRSTAGRPNHKQRLTRSRWRSSDIYRLVWRNSDKKRSKIACGQSVNQWLINLLEQMAAGATSTDVNRSENQKKCVRILWQWLLRSVEMRTYSLVHDTNELERDLGISAPGLPNLWIANVMASCSDKVLVSFLNQLTGDQAAAKDEHDIADTLLPMPSTEILATHKIHDLVIDSLERNAHNNRTTMVSYLSKYSEERGRCSVLRPRFVRARAKWLEKCCETNQLMLFEALITKRLDWSDAEAMAQHQIHTPRLMHTAITHGHIDMVKYLLKLGVSSTYDVDGTLFGLDRVKVLNDTITASYQGCPKKYAIVTSLMVGQFDVTKLLSDSEEDSLFLDYLCDQSDETLVFEKICARIYCEKTITPRQLFIVVQCFWRMNSIIMSENQTFGDEFTVEHATLIPPIRHRKGARLMRKALQAVKINQSELNRTFAVFNPSIQEPIQTSVSQEDPLFLSRFNLSIDAKERIQNLNNSNDQAWSLLAECISMNEPIAMPTPDDLFNAINRDKGLHGHFWISQCWDWRFDITRWDEIRHYLYSNRIGRLDSSTMMLAHEATLWMLTQKVHTILEDQGPMRGLNTNSSIDELYFTDLQASHRTHTTGRQRNHVQHSLEALWEERGNTVLPKDTFERLKNELNHAQENHLPGLNINASINELYFTDLQAFHRTRTNARHKNHAQYWLEALWEMRGNRALLKDTFERLKNELNHAQENHLYKKITHFVCDTPRGQFCRAVWDDQNNSEGFNVDIRKGSGHVFNLGYIARLAEQNHFKDSLFDAHFKEYGSWMERIRLAIIPSLNIKGICQDAILRILGYLIPFEKSRLTIQKGGDIQEIHADKLFGSLIEAYERHAHDSAQQQEGQEQTTKHTVGTSAHR